MILTIKHIAYGKLIRQKKRKQMNHENNHKNESRVTYEYQAGDRVMLKNNQYYKHKIQYKEPYEIIQTWENGTVMLQMGEMIDIINTHQINPYKS